MSQFWRDLADLSSAEDFFAYFDLTFDPKVMAVRRLHILKRFHDNLSRVDGLELLDVKATRDVYRRQLADAYCERGSFNHKEKKYDAADGCSCDPYNPLIALYDSVGRQYDKSWDIVHKAQRSRRWIMPESLERLKKDSGRNS